MLLVYSSPTAESYFITRAKTVGMFCMQDFLETAEIKAYHTTTASPSETKDEKPHKGKHKTIKINNT